MAMRLRDTICVLGLLIFVLSSRVEAADGVGGLSVQKGWYVHGDAVVLGYVQHNGWWRAGQRPNLARNAPQQAGPNRTEDLEQLTNAMLRYGYPGFEHNFGLWYDRRRDAHDERQRRDSRAKAPFLEQPWARTQQGVAWDGLPKYDLTKYNDWYFQRLKKFADLCDRQGAILFHNHYMQHALLETNAHYVDFPWRPTNCIQDTEMPNRNPAASAFYDISHPTRRALHRAYIRKCLDALGANTNVVFLCSEEFTGPKAFMEFWLDTIADWERETSAEGRKRRKVHVGLSATKDVLDGILADRERAKNISTIDLRYWWYQSDGRLFAPPGGRDVAGRFTHEIRRTTPEQIHRQVIEYRKKFPGKAIIHGNPGTRQHAWAAWTGGASMLVGQLPYPGKSDPKEYISPELCEAIQPSYEFVRKHLAATWPQMSCRDDLIQADNPVWCLATPSGECLIYAVRGGAMDVNLSNAAGSFRARWLDPRTGVLKNVREGAISGGAVVQFEAPDERDWALWLSLE